MGLRSRHEATCPSIASGSPSARAHPHAVDHLAIDKLARLIGMPRCPVLIDVQTDEDFAVDPRLIPGAIRRPWSRAAEWARELAGQSAIVISQKGLKISQGVDAWLRPEGIRADSLVGGALAWAQTGLPMVPEAKLPPGDVGPGYHKQHRPERHRGWDAQCRPSLR